MKSIFGSHQKICMSVDRSLALRVERGLGTSRPTEWGDLLEWMQAYLECEVFDYKRDLEESWKITQEILNEQQEDFLNFCAKPTLEAVLLMGKLFPLAVCLWLRSHNKGTLYYHEDAIVKIDDDGSFCAPTQEELYDWFGYVEDCPL